MLEVNHYLNLKPKICSLRCFLKITKGSQVIALSFHITKTITWKVFNNDSGKPIGKCSSFTVAVDFQFFLQYIFVKTAR